MNTKTVESTDVIFGSEYITIPEIGKWSELITPLVLAEVERYGLEVSGDWIFISYGRNGGPAARMVHEYCLPVRNIRDYKGALSVKTLPPFRCAYAGYKGDLSPEMFGGLGYAPLVEKISGSGKAFTGESREVYRRWIPPDSPDNEIEIQFGIQD